MVIIALDYVAQCYTYEDGQVLANLIAPALDADEDVIVSFNGVDDVPSSFVNGAFVALLLNYSFESLRRHLHVVDSTRQINGLIKARLEAGLVHA